jgi:hypothetical protein
MTRRLGSRGFCTPGNPGTSRQASYAHFLDNFGNKYISKGRSSPLVVRFGLW